MGHAYPAEALQAGQLDDVMAWISHVLPRDATHDQEPPGTAPRRVAPVSGAQALRDAIRNLDVTRVFEP
jgi:hypothetical protein